MIGIRRKGSWRGHGDDARRRDRRCWGGRHLPRGPTRRRAPGVGDHPLRALEPDRRPAPISAGRRPCPPDRARRHALSHEPPSRPVGRHRARHPDPTVRRSSGAGAFVPPWTDRRRPERSHGGRRVRPCRRRSATVRRSTSPWMPSNASCPGARDIAPADWPGTRATVAYLDRPITDGRSRTPWRRSGARRATSSSGTPSAMTRDSIRTTPGMRSSTSSAATTRAPRPGYRSRAWTGSRVPSRPDSRSAAEPSSSGRTFDASRWMTASCGSSSPTGPRSSARRLVLAIPIPALTALVAYLPGARWPGVATSAGIGRGLPGDEALLLVRPPMVARRAGRSRPASGRPPTSRTACSSTLTTTETDRPRCSLPSTTTGAPNPSWPWPAVPPTASLPLDRCSTRSRGTCGRSIRVPTSRSPIGSAFMHWGSDPREIAWTFWRAGSTRTMRSWPRANPSRDVPIHVCGETFSRAQAWVEGALATAHAVGDLLLEERRAMDA